MASVIYAHVEVTPEDIPYIVGTQTKMIEVILDRLAYPTGMLTKSIASIRISALAKSTVR